MAVRCGREAVEPEADVAAGTVHEDDGGMGVECCGLVHVDADVAAAGAEGALHGDWMRVEGGRACQCAASRMG